MRFVRIRNLLLILFFLLLYAFFSVGCETGGTEPSVVKRVHRPIVMGTATNYEKWQSAVMVQLAEIMCTGTLIHPELVLTAGHCIYMNTDNLNYDFRNRPDVVYIYGGSRGEDFLGYADKVVVHSGWTGDISRDAADLAFIRLAEPIDNIEPSRLRDFPTAKEGDTGVIVGYGSDPFDTSGQFPLHREGETTILDASQYYFEIGGETNTCSGDSGGPMFTEQDGEWVLTAVTSFGAESCDVASDGYSVNLLYYCAWLNDTMTDLVGTDLGLDDCKGCDAVAVEAWGQPCGPGHACCPSGTRCRTPEEFSDGVLGFCAPTCCSLGNQDSVCSDVTDGEERCTFVDEKNESYCAISCDDDDDCLAGTVCRNKPFSSDKICIAREVGDGDGCDPSKDTDEGDDDSDSSEIEEGASDSGGGRCSVSTPGRGSSSFVFSVVSTILIG